MVLSPNSLNHHLLWTSRSLVIRLCEDGLLMDDTQEYVPPSEVKRGSKVRVRDVVFP